jgi:hypothetical protein
MTLQYCLAGLVGLVLAGGIFLLAKKASESELGSKILREAEERRNKERSGVAD